MHKKESDRNGMSVELINEITAEHINEVLISIGEANLDTVLGEGVLKNIPILSSIYKLYKSAVAIENAWFTQNICRFLASLKDVPQNERTEFIDRMEEDQDYRGRVGETLIIVLSKVDDRDKPAIIGNLFKAAIRGKINFDLFRRLASIVNRSFLPDLVKIKSIADPNTLSNDLKEQYASLGIYSTFLKPEGIKVERQSSNGTAASIDYLPLIVYQINEAGKALIEHGW